MKNHYRDIFINEHQIRFCHFADDINLLADSKQKLSLILILDLSLAKFKPKINFKNTKAMDINMGDTITWVNWA